MEATREQMKEEAIKRMKMLGINPPTIEEFERGDKLNVSRGGFLYWLDDEYKAKVAEFEEKYGGLVFAAIESNTEFGKLLSILYVSTHQDEWECDRLGLKSGEVFAYVFNLDAEECSEFGFITFTQSISPDRSRVEEDRQLWCRTILATIMHRSSL